MWFHFEKPFLESAGGDVGCVATDGLAFAHVNAQHFSLPGHSGAEGKTIRLPFPGTCCAGL